MIPPSTPQQYGLAYAPKPFAAASLLASCYMVHHLVFRERKKLARLYHRLVLAMNVALLPVSAAWFWGNWAVPRGTPDKIGASGTVNTCTAQGFISYMFTSTVAIYYASLILQALMGVRHSFKEAKYAYIEKWIHAVAWIIPGAFSTLIAVTENFNPNVGATCWIEKSPLGCESDTDLECQRGQDIGRTGKILAGFLLLFYLASPPSVAASMYCWIKLSQEKMLVSRGFQKVREAAKKQMMHSVAKQICLYVFAFWFIWLFNLIHYLYRRRTDECLWNITILGQSIYAMQGLIFVVVYFSLERMGKVHIVGGSSENMTVQNLKSSAEKTLNASDPTVGMLPETMNFNVFDGTPDEDSPWAKYLVPEDDDDEVEGQTCEERN